MQTKTFDIKRAFNRLKDNKTVFSYLGKLSDDEFDGVLSHIEKVLITNLDSKSSVKKVFNILIESTQNLHSYLRDPDKLKEKENVIVVVKECDQYYSVMTGNYLLKSEISVIKSRIDIINTLSKKEVKELYRGILDIGMLGQSGGAGLGLVDLARRSDNKLTYNFKEIDSKFAFFTLEVKVLV